MSADREEDNSKLPAATQASQPNSLPAPPKATHPGSTSPARHICLQIHCVSDFLELPDRTGIKLANAGSRNPPTTDLPPVLSSTHSTIFGLDPLLPPLAAPIFTSSSFSAKKPATLSFSTSIQYPPPLVDLPLDLHSSLYSVLVLIA